MKSTYKEILKQLEKRQFANVYFLAGEEPLFIDKISDYIEENVMDEADRDFNQSVYYAKETNPAEVIAQAREFPFGVDKRVVIVKEAKEWRSLDLIMAYCANPTTTTILVICYKYGKMPSNKALSDAVTFNSEKVPDWKLGEWVENCAKEHSFQISRDSANLIAEHIGNDLSRIDNEFTKLRITYPEGTTITPEIIDRHIGISNQYNLYALRDALCERNETKAFTIVNAFCQNLKANPLQAAIGSLYYLYSGMLKYQHAPTKNMEEQRLCFGPRRSEAQLRRDVAITSGFSKQTLVRNIALLREFDVMSKGVDCSTTEEELYKELIYKLLH